MSEIPKDKMCPSRFILYDGFPFKHENNEKTFTGTASMNTTHF